MTDQCDTENFQRRSDDDVENWTDSPLLAIDCSLILPVLLATPSLQNSIMYLIVSAEVI
jgi:hypothetical protein